LEEKGYGFEFDASGRITNYTAIMRGLAASLNDEDFKKAQDLVKQYEETLNLSEDVSNQIVDNHYAIFDAKLEKITTKVDIQLDINERDKEYLDFLKELAEGKSKNSITLITNFAE
jgi:predicted ribosome quality control (RQC) complex YloA/Tae2 family protein